jgi:hypothetical protein
MDLEYMQQLADAYYNHLTEDEKVVVVCTGYDDLAVPKARLISFIDNRYYVLGCKPDNNIEIYRDFKYKGECTPMKYGGFFVENSVPYQAWTLKIMSSP